MECGVPFCHNGCPLGNLIPDWNDLVYREPLARRDRPAARDEQLPGVHRPPVPGAVRGRRACSRSREGDAVTIKQIENSIIDRAWEQGWVKPQPPKHETGRRVAVVGSGPGGHGGRAAAAPRRPPRHAVRARRVRRRPVSLRRAGLQDREAHRAAARRPARRPRASSCAAASTSASTSPPSSCARTSTRSCWRPARARRATCRCPAASSRASTSRWSTCRTATAGSRRRPARRPAASRPSCSA